MESGMGGIRIDSQGLKKPHIKLPVTRAAAVHIRHKA